MISLTSSCFIMVFSHFSCSNSFEQATVHLQLYLCYCRCGWNRVLHVLLPGKNPQESLKWCAKNFGKKNQRFKSYATIHVQLIDRLFKLLELLKPHNQVPRAHWQRFSKWHDTSVNRASVLCNVQFQLTDQLNNYTLNLPTYCRLTS